MPAFRLYDLKPDEQIVLHCTNCRRIVTVSLGDGPYSAQRFFGVPFDTAIVDIVPRLRCENCGARTGFGVRVEILDTSRSHLVDPLPPIAIISEQSIFSTRHAPDAARFGEYLGAGVVFHGL